MAYKEDIGRLYIIIDEVCQGLKSADESGRLLTAAPAAMCVSDLDDHGVDICLRGDTKYGEQWALTGELRKRIKNRFDQEIIEIPWPRPKVYFGDAKVTP